MTAGLSEDDPPSTGPIAAIRKVPVDRRHQFDVGWSVSQTRCRRQVPTDSASLSGSSRRVFLMCPSGDLDREGLDRSATSVATCLRRVETSPADCCALPRSPDQCCASCPADRKLPAVSCAGRSRAPCCALPDSSVVRVVTSADRTCIVGELLDMVSRTRPTAPPPDRRHQWRRATARQVAETVGELVDGSLGNVRMSVTRDMALLSGIGSMPVLLRRRAAQSQGSVAPGSWSAGRPQSATRRQSQFGRSPDWHPPPPCGTRNRYRSTRPSAVVSSSSARTARDNPRSVRDFQDPGPGEQGLDRDGQPVGDSARGSRHWAGQPTFHLGQVGIGHPGLRGQTPERGSARHVVREMNSRGREPGSARGFSPSCPPPTKPIAAIPTPCSQDTPSACNCKQAVSTAENTNLWHHVR